MKAQRVIFEIYLDYVQHYGNSIRISSLLRLTSAVGLSQNAARAAICRLAKQGWLERSTHQKHGFYALTPIGRERLAEVRPRIFATHTDSWDGHWTILTYTVSERVRHYRDRLRRELTWLGFGPLTPATWISPNPVVEMTLRHLALRKLDAYVHLFRSRQVSSQPHSALIQRCYNLRAVQQRYEAFLRKWQPIWAEYRTRSAGQPLSNDLCFVAKMRLLDDFAAFLYVDPFLPSELLPDEWQGHEAWQLFRDCYLLLAEPALDFFEGCFEGPTATLQEQRGGKERVLESTFARFAAGATAGTA